MPIPRLHKKCSTLKINLKLELEFHVRSDSMSVGKNRQIGLGRRLAMFGGNSGPLGQSAYKSASFCVIS